MKERHTGKAPETVEWHRFFFPGCRFLARSEGVAVLPCALMILASLPLSVAAYAQTPEARQPGRDLSNAGAWQLSARKIDYGRISHMLAPPGREHTTALVFYARGDGLFRLRLKEPLQLTGYLTSLQVMALGSGAGEQLFAVFEDRLGRIVRLPAGKLDQPGWHSLSVLAAGRLRHRPLRVSEEAWVRFVGWDVEADRSRETETAWLLLADAAFQVEPYRMDPP